MTGCLCHGLERPDPLADGCDCQGCQTLRAEMALDMPLDPRYGCHLLIKGWAGGVSKGERAYRLAHMSVAQASQKSPNLRRRGKSEPPGAKDDSGASTSGGP